MRDRVEQGLLALAAALFLAAAAGIVVLALSTWELAAQVGQAPAGAGDAARGDDLKVSSAGRLPGR